MTTLAAGGRSASAAIQSAHQAAGLPSAPAWAGYWTFVTGSIIVAFILYTAQKGTLATWLGFLWWQTPQQIGQTQQSQQTPVGTVLGVPGVTTLSPGATGIIQGPGGTEILNPGAPFSVQSILNGLTNPFKMFTGK